MTPTHISSHNLLTDLEPGNKSFSSTRGTLPCCVRVSYNKVTQFPLYVVKYNQCCQSVAGHTYLKCRAVTQHQGPGGPGSPTLGRRGVRRQAPKVGVFPPMLCYMAITPAVRQGPVRLGLGGLIGSGQSSPSSCPPTVRTTTRWWQKKRAEQSRAGEITNYMKRNPGYFHLIPSFQQPPPFLH